MKSISNKTGFYRQAANTSVVDKPESIVVPNSNANNTQNANLDDPYDASNKTADYIKKMYVMMFGKSAHSFADMVTVVKSEENKQKLIQTTPFAKLNEAEITYIISLLDNNYIEYLPATAFSRQDTVYAVLRSLCMNGAKTQNAEEFKHLLSKFIQYGSLQNLPLEKRAGMAVLILYKLYSSGLDYELLNEKNTAIANFFTPDVVSSQSFLLSANAYQLRLPMHIGFIKKGVLQALKDMYDIPTLSELFRKTLADVSNNETEKIFALPQFSSIANLKRLLNIDILNLYYIPKSIIASEEFKIFFAEYCKNSIASNAPFYKIQLAPVFKGLLQDLRVAEAVIENPHASYDLKIEIVKQHANSEELFNKIREAQKKYNILYYHALLLNFDYSLPSYNDAVQDAIQVTGNIEYVSEKNPQFRNLAMLAVKYDGENLKYVKSLRRDKEFLLEVLEDPPSNPRFLINNINFENLKDPDIALKVVQLEISSNLFDHVFGEEGYMAQGKKYQFLGEDLMHVRPTIANGESFPKFILTDPKHEKFFLENIADVPVYMSHLKPEQLTKENILEIFKKCQKAEHGQRDAIANLLRNSNLVTRPYLFSSLFNDSKFLSELVSITPQILYHSSFIKFVLKNAEKDNIILSAMNAYPDINAKRNFLYFLQQLDERIITPQILAKSKMLERDESLRKPKNLEYQQLKGRSTEELRSQLSTLQSQIISLKQELSILKGKDKQKKQNEIAKLENQSKKLQDKLEKVPTTDKELDELLSEEDTESFLASSDKKWERNSGQNFKPDSEETAMLLYWDSEFYGTLAQDKILTKFLSIQPRFSHFFDLTNPIGWALVYKDPQNKFWVINQIQSDLFSNLRNMIAESHLEIKDAYSFFKQKNFRTPKTYPNWIFDEIVKTEHQPIIEAVINYAIDQSRVGTPDYEYYLDEFYNNTLTQFIPIQQPTEKDVESLRSFLTTTKNDIINYYTNLSLINTNDANTKSEFLNLNELNYVKEKLGYLYENWPYIVFHNVWKKAKASGITNLYMNTSETIRGGLSQGARNYYYSYVPKKLGFHKEVANLRGQNEEFWYRKAHSAGWYKNMSITGF